MSFYKLPLSYIHIELTTRCNAACPMCLRNINGDIKNPYLNIDDFDIKWLDKIDIPVGKKVLLCGNYGDPIAYPHLFEFIEAWNKKFGTSITIMTNGGARNVDWWKKLATITDNKIKVIFGIDGLEDTNHLYRRNVKWKKLMENAKAFIDAGGTAWWKFIIFKHNQHQLHDAKKLATNMGFENFEQIKTNRFENNELPVLDKTGNTLYKLYEPDIPDDVFYAKNSYRSVKSIDPESVERINCYAKKESSMYIAADGRVYPCCNTGYHYSGPNRREMEIAQETQTPYSLTNSKVSEIINGDFFRGFEKTWTTTPYKKCHRVCGYKRGILHKVEDLK